MGNEERFNKIAHDSADRGQPVPTRFRKERKKAHEGMFKPSADWFRNRTRRSAACKMTIGKNL
ncbi:hypothetical protein HPP92_013031 [Vanilla planifolia]|uniref:Uncharacterized protein n=1 Tax=Vanilla planifolia TaxID=51239 RepID=A0A835QTS8_VANPL|nr:hypothetical protein HPP92_013031 [Vanilla planifolia]